MRFRLASTVVVLLALSASARSGSDEGKPIVLRVEDIGLRAVEGENISRRKAKLVLKECRRAFANIANDLGVNSGHVFHLKRRIPFWMKSVDIRDPRIWVQLEDRFRVSDMGAEAYVARMRKGVLRIHIPAPSDDLGPEDRHRIWREMAHAILAQTCWRAAPLWLREGLAEVMAGKGTEEAHSLLPALKQELEEMGDDVPVAAILCATDRTAWARASGRAVSWGLVRMLTEAKPRLPAVLYSQVRMLLAHMMAFPDESVVVREHTHLVRDQLGGVGVTAKDLKAALVAWVRAGYPTGYAFRKTKPCDRLRRVGIPKLFGVRLDARFGPTVSIPDMNGIMVYEKTASGEAAWRMPWRTSMQAWFGVHGRAGIKPVLDPRRLKDGYVLDYGTWSARHEGRKLLRERRMSIPRPTTKFGFLWLGITSPNGVRYLYEYERRLK